MQKFRYGPLIWNCVNEEDESGNYFWNGKPPVDYDGAGIPIDEDGNQCLPIECPIHPGFVPKRERCKWNEAIQNYVPEIEYYREWFEDNFLVIADLQIKKYILKWVVKVYINRWGYQRLRTECQSIEKMIGRLWPQDAHKSLTH